MTMPKILISLFFALLLQAGNALAEDIPSNNVSSSSDNTVILETTDQAPSASALDLSFFGVIALGVIGLFWIRRHTSEL
jgi:hypothetical protein